VKNRSARFKPFQSIEPYKLAVRGTDVCLQSNAIVSTVCNARDNAPDASTQCATANCKALCSEWFERADRFQRLHPRTYLCRVNSPKSLLACRQATKSKRYQKHPGPRSAPPSCVQIVDEWIRVRSGSGCTGNIPHEYLPNAKTATRSHSGDGRQCDAWPDFRDISVCASADLLGILTNYGKRKPVPLHGDMISAPQLSNCNRGGCFPQRHRQFCGFGKSAWATVGARFQLNRILLSRKLVLTERACRCQFVFVFPKLLSRLRLFFMLRKRQLYIGPKTISAICDCVSLGFQARPLKYLVL